MIIEIYLFFAIIAFISFYVAIFVNKSMANLFIWPVAIILFSSLFFASYNIEKSNVILMSENRTTDGTNTSIIYNYDKSPVYFTEPAFSWIFLILALLSVVLFLWDIWDKKIKSKLY